MNVISWENDLKKTCLSVKALCIFFRLHHMYQNPCHGCTFCNKEGHVHSRYSSPENTPLLVSEWVSEWVSDRQWHRCMVLLTFSHTQTSVNRKYTEVDVPAQPSGVAGESIRYIPGPFTSVFQSATEKQRKKLLLKVSTIIPKWSQKPWVALYDMRKLFKNGLDEPMVRTNLKCVTLKCLPFAIVCGYACVTFVYTCCRCDWSTLVDMCACPCVSGSARQCGGTTRGSASSVWRASVHDSSGSAPNCPTSKSPETRQVTWCTARLYVCVLVTLHQSEMLQVELL